MFPALVLETVDALSVSCVFCFPRLQSLLWAPALSATPWGSSALSIPHWWAPALSAPPWRSSAMSVPPWYLLSCSVVFLECGSVMNQVHGLSFARHQSSLLHHIDFHTTQTVTYYPGLHFPAAISLITCAHLRTITQSHSLHEPWTFFHRSPSIVLSIELPQC